MGKGHIKSPRDELSFSLGEISREVDIALQLWGKRAYPDYTVFQPVVDLGLGIVETEAEQLIEAEIDLTVITVAPLTKGNIRWWSAGPGVRAGFAAG